MAAYKMEPSAAGGSTRRAESVDYFLRNPSFSEVEDTQSRLRALADRRISALRSRRAELNLERQKVASSDHSASYERRVAELLTAMGDASQAFRGTAHESLFTQDLLWFFEREDRLDTWLDTYLDFLYRNPTHGLVDRFAADALEFGRALRRERDVAAARDYVRRIPHNYGAQEIAVAIGPETRSVDAVKFYN